MPSLFSLCWRALLIAALVLNPMAAATASMAKADATAKAAMAADEAVPPCHGMPSPRHHDSATMKPGDSSRHGCDCGDPACQFAACCAGVLSLASVRIAAPVYAGAQALPVFGVSAAPAPPPARMIRPPIG